jgi:hypothetical protein
MTHRGHLAILLAAALLLTATAAVAQGPPPRLEIRRGDEVVVTRTEPPGAVRVLFVGNSLTYFNELPWLFQQVVASRRPEPPVVTRFSGGSGRSLRRHWELGEVARLLRTSRWDFVVLQEQSHRPLGEPDEHARYLALFLAEARHHGASPVVFEIWPPRREPSNHPRLREAYRRLEANHGVPVAPIGTAWQAASEAGIPVYRDVIHPNLAGTYLTACVLAATLFDLDPRGATASFPTSFEHVERHRQSLVEEHLTPETARKLQELAWEAVRKRREAAPPRAVD